MSETAVPHVHDCTGPTMTCPCGFVFSVPRYCVSIEVFDGDGQVTLINDGFNCERLSAAISALRRAIEKLERLESAS